MTFDSLPDYRRDVPLEQQIDLVVEAFTGRRVAESVSVLADEVEADLVVVDANLGGALAAAESLACTTAVLLHSLWATYVDVWFGQLWPFFSDALNATRSALGLRAVDGWGEVFAGHDRLIAAVPSEFDAPTAIAPPASLHHAGFLVPTANGQSVSFPAGSGPRVVVGLSTTEMSQQSLLARIVEALAGLEVRAVVTTAGRATVANAPLHVRVVERAPHSVLLQQADLMVTHAGLGSVAAAFSAGVPMVCTPIDRDQPLNAERITSLGAGVTVGQDASPAVIAEAVMHVLSNSSFRERARDLATANAAVGGANDAVADLERLADASR